MKKNLIAYIVLMVAIISTSCVVTKPYKVPEAGTQALIRDASADTSNMAHLHWTEVFRDTLLQKLIQEGIDNNLNIKIAYSRIQQAQAYFNQSRQAFLPNLSAGADVTKTGGNTTKANSSLGNTLLYQLNVNASWEADIWGKLKSSKRASLASLLQSDAFRRAVQTDIVAGIADYYYILLGLDQQVQITQQSIKNWIATVETMKALKTAAIVTEAAVVQSEANRYATEVTLPDLKLSIRQAENALSILLGRVPGPISRTTISEQHPGTLLQTGVPAQLLANRPDVQEAELNFRYNFEMTNVARTYFYPSLIISGNGGLNNFTAANLFNPLSIAGSITAGIVQPIFNQGVNRLRLTVAREAQQQALLSFQNALLTAGEEVSNDISAYQSSLEKVILRDHQIQDLLKAVEYTQLLVRYSSANYTEVLTAQQSLLSAQLGQVNDRLQQLQAMAHLYRDLGGGWK